MSIKNIREALQAAGIAGANTATMRYGEHEPSTGAQAQIYVIGGKEIERPAGEMASVSVVELVRALKG